MTALKELWLELTNPRVQEDEPARQKYLTHVIYVMVSAGLLLMTLIVLAVNYGIGEPSIFATIIIVTVDFLVVIGWVFLLTDFWRISGYLLPLVFLVASGYMIFVVGPVTTGLLLLAIAVLLAGVLLGNQARWITLMLSMIVFVGAGWEGGEHDIEVFLTSGISVFMSLSGIALLEWFFSNLLNRSLRTVREREEKLQSIFRAAPIGIGMAVDRVIQETNPTLCQMTGFSRDEMIGKDARMLYPSQEDYEFVGDEKARQIRERGIGTVETHWRQKDGRIRDILLSSVPLDPNNLARGVTFSVLDITERKEADEKQKALLKEKDILLAEVHHRVKNNMQIIVSLLGLQAREIEDERVLAAFEESRNRINSMALVHEQLYRAREYAKIDFSTYIDQLASTLFNMYQVEHERIQLKIEAEGAYLDLEKAIPCGLLLNELIVNSLKYAFPDGRKGALWIKLVPDKEKMTLIVGDDGVGMPASFDFETSQSLGLQLVNMLTKHDLQGHIRLERKKGTIFCIEFPV